MSAFVRNHLLSKLPRMITHNRRNTMVSAGLPPPAPSSRFQELLNNVKASHSLEEPAASSFAASLFELEMARKGDEMKVQLITAEANLKVALSELKVSEAELEKIKKVSEAESKLRIISEDAALKDLARISAILANRCLMECALDRLDVKYGVKHQRGMTIQYYDFLKNMVLTGTQSNDSFRGEAKDFYDTINEFSAVSASEQDVKNELSILVHTLSSPVHYTTKPMSGLPGCYIGGGLSPFYNALGICIAILKKEGCCPDTIYLANEHLKTFAKIDDNGIVRI